MKKYYISSLLVAATVIFSYCNSAKKATAIEIRPTYENGVASLITTHCTPCHITEKAGKKKPYDNYINVKTDIDEIIRSSMKIRDGLWLIGKPENLTTAII